MKVCFDEESKITSSNDRVFVEPIGVFLRRNDEHLVSAIFLV